MDGSHMVNFCNFIYLEDKWECSNCGNIVQILDDYEDPPLFPCGGPQLKSDNIATEVFDFFSKNTSESICDENTINYRHSICKSCEFYNNNVCTECGCDITRERNYLNKLAILSERCPKHKW
jgi:hypothetical protein